VIVVGILTSAHAGRSAGVSLVEIARRAAASGARTEVVGVAPAGPVGDRQLLELATARVGHATITRSAALAIDAADLELALRYLPDVRCIVVVAPTAAMLATAIAASAWSGAGLLVIGPLDEDASAAIAAAPPGAGAPIVLDPPARDPDGGFAGVVAALAVRLDAGEDPSSAWRTTVAALSLDPA
jgi:hypothetical protein